MTNPETGSGERKHQVTLMVNGKSSDIEVPARKLLSDAIRIDLGLTGTHVGCEHGVCGCCTVIIDGLPMRSCLTFAVAADGRDIRTVEGLAEDDGTLHPVQEAFRECHGLQCGFCTPGFLMTATALLERNPDPDDDEIRRSDRRQPLPLHRLPEHPEGRGPGRRAGPRTRRLTDVHCGGQRLTGLSFGQPIRRNEDERLVTGRGSYTDDVGGDAWALVMVRSTFAHARIASIDTAAAKALDGVVAVWTFDDLPGRLQDPLPLLIPHPSLTAARTQEVLANDRVRHVGQAIAAVLATDRYIGEDAAELVVVDYEPLAPVVGIDGALGADLVHDDVADNVAAHHIEHVGDVDAALASAPHVLELDLDMERSMGSALEGRACHAVWDRHRRQLRVQNATQTPTSVRFALANILGLPDEQVEVAAIDVGGGFGTKVIHPWPEDILTAWAAMTHEHEVKFTEDRTEHFISSSHERAQRHHVKVGFDDDGRIVALDVDFVHDNGAFTHYGMIAPLITATQLPGPYKLPNYRVEFRSVYTTTVQVTPYRGAARPHAVFTMERTIDRIAAISDSIERPVRQTNFIQPDEFPYDLAMIFQDGRPAIYDSGNYPELLDKAWR